MRSMPYYRTVQTTAKGRWQGHSLEYVSREVGAVVSGPNQIVRNKDILQYTVHVHEGFVPKKQLDILHNDDKLVVVNKPPGMPTHPTGNYFSSTVTELLKPIFGSLYPCYRLDRLTSGVLILARTPEVAAAFLQSQDRSKHYLARVAGKPLLSETELVIKSPIVTFNAKRGFDAFLTALANPKPAETRFELLAEQSNGSSTLKCTPITGRTHQIRKHLALYGMPIQNDELYADGTFKQLLEDPTQTNFEKLIKASEARRVMKLIGSRCPECNTELYHDVVESIDLHCAEYRVGDAVYTCAPPWLLSQEP